MQKHYPAKILLFGEYTIIKGSQALAMPLSLYSGSWAQVVDSQNALDGQQDLPGLLVYLEKLEQEEKLLAPLDLHAFRQDLAAGWYFDSSIPGGYGAGSSGAVCAAIYGRYRLNISDQPNDDLLSLRKQLAQIEHFFHGSSSGTDPLICYLNTALHIYSPAQLESIALPKPSIATPSIFLLNTRMARETAPLVQVFLEKCKTDSFLQEALTPLIALNNRAIANFLQADWPNLLIQLKAISQLQYTYFEEMIPEAFRKIWLEGLDSDAYYLKLCGAGGGGFILGFTQEWQVCQEILKEYELIIFSHSPIRRQEEY